MVELCFSWAVSNNCSIRRHADIPLLDYARGSEACDWMRLSSSTGHHTLFSIFRSGVSTNTANGKAVPLTAAFPSFADHPAFPQ
jgi:hypothetical protein